MEKTEFTNRLKKGTLIFCAMLSIFFSSCYYDYGIEQSNYDVVATFYNKDYNFSNITNYYLVDSVFHLEQEGSITRNYDAQILSAIENNLNSLGWQRVYDTLQTKIVVGVGVTTSETTVISGNYSWWSYWSYGWYYPHYAYSYTYSIGTIGILLTDLNTRSGGDLPVHWNAIISGLLGQNASGERITSTIKQAFNQSPYLK